MNRLLPAKNRHNILSMVLFLAVRWFLLFVATLAGAVAVSAHSFLGVLASPAQMLALLRVPRAVCRAWWSARSWASAT